jgi:hypothetical protein
MCKPGKIIALNLAQTLNADMGLARDYLKR